MFVYNNYFLHGNITPGTPNHSIIMVVPTYWELIWKEWDRIGLYNIMINMVSMSTKKKNVNILFPSLFPVLCCYINTHVPRYLLFSDGEIFSTLALMFVWGFSSHSRIFHQYGDVTGEGREMFTYTRHLWPLCSEGSLEWHTYCGTGHPLIMVISEDPWHSHPLPSV